MLHPLPVALHLVFRLLGVFPFAFKYYPGLRWKYKKSVEKSTNQKYRLSSRIFGMASNHRVWEGFPGFSLKILRTKMMLCF